MQRGGLFMAVRNVRPESSKPNRTPPTALNGRSPSGANGHAPKRERSRYRPLPTGTHGLDPEMVKRDQRERLQQAMVELIGQKGYSAVRIVDLAKLARVSQPTFYALYGDKEELFVSAYEEIVERTAKTVLDAYNAEGSQRERLLRGMRAFAELAAAEPAAVSLRVLGAFGAGGKVLERRSLSLDALEGRIRAIRDGVSAENTSDLTVKAVLGGIREVTAARLRQGRERELSGLVEEIVTWASSYPRQLPAGLAAPPARREAGSAGCKLPASARARRAEGRLPSGRSDLPRQFIVKSQRERIVDATAAIVAEKGLAGLTIPEIARRANISHQTFYAMYASKHEAFLGAQKVGMHQALRVAVEAYEEHKQDWPRAVGAGLRALIDYLASEPAHAHLSLIDTFAACPEAIEIRNAMMNAFTAYLAPGYELAAAEGTEVPSVAAEAITGGVWQVFHHYIENDCLAELPGAAPQLTYFALTPFLGPRRAAQAAGAQPSAERASA
jgi:AcrR family transcriptional regulator